MRSLIVLVLTAQLGCVGELEVMPPAADAGGALDSPDAGPPPAATPQQLLAEWSGCMNIDNWRTSGMGSWAHKLTEGGTVCSSCHNAGLARFHAHADDDLMFDYNRYEVFITGFFTVGSAGGDLEVMPSWDRLDRMAAGEADHPTFPTGQADAHYQALQQFYDLTAQARAAGDCAPAGFPQP